MTAVSHLYDKRQNKVMSKSPDNLRGTEVSPIVDDTSAERLLGDNEEEQKQEEDRSATRPGMGRKARSLFTIPVGPKRHGGHHRHKSSIGQLMETIGEGVQAEARMVKDAWDLEIRESVRGDRYFLDMAMCRSLSVLPEELMEFEEEATGHRRRRSVITGEIEPLPKTPAVGVSSYLGLLGAVFAVSSNGTALALLHDVEPALKLFWRMSAVAVLLSFFAIKSMTKQYKDEGTFLPKLTGSQWVTFVSAALCFFLSTLLLFTALTMTSIGNAVIGANSQALLLVIAKLITGEAVHWMEGIGVLLAFGGCVLCSADEAHEKSEDNDESTSGSKAILGDLMALASAAAGVCYLTFAKAVRSTMSVTVFMFMVMCTGCCLCFVYIATSHIEWTFDNNPHTGLFGWCTLVDYHVLILLYIAVVCNVVGTMGFVRAMEYFENIIIAVATLLEPLIATLIAFVLGVGDLPGMFGWIGNLLVAIGTLGVVYPSMKDGKGDNSGH